MDRGIEVKLVRRDPTVKITVQHRELADQTVTMELTLDQARKLRADLTTELEAAE